MADSLNVSLIIRAIDRATAPIRKVTRNFEAMRAASKRAEHAFGKAASMRQAAEGVATFARKARGALTAPISAFETFEEAIAELSGVAKMTGAPLQRLETEALRLGKAVGEFDPTGAAQGMIELARAGYDEAAIMETLPALLDLSTVSHMGLAETTKIVTGIMGGFSLKASQATRVSDVLTAAATSSKVTLQTLGETFEYVGPVARKAGLSLEQTAIIAGALGNSSIEASRAGTALNAVLLRMAGARRGPGSKILKEMGIELDTLVDGVKKARDPIAVIGDIGKKIAKLGEREQLGKLGRIFGAEAAASAAVLAEALGDIRVETLTENVNNATGGTKEMAEAFRKTGANETKQLTSAISTLNIALGREMKEQTHMAKEVAKGLVETLGEWTAAHPTLTKGVLGTVGVTAILATVLAGLMFTMAAATTAVGVLSIALGSSKTGAEILGWAIRWVGLRLKALSVVIWSRALPALWGWTAAILKKAMPTFSAWAVAIWARTVPAIIAFAVAIWTKAIPAMIAWIAKLWASAAAGIAAAGPFLLVAAAIGAVTLAIIQLIKHWDELDFAEGMKGITQSIEESGVLSTLGQLFDPRTLLKDIGIMGPGSSIPALAAPLATGSQQRVAVDIKVDAEGRTNIERAESDPGVELSTDTGFAMGPP